jgi:transglutaminase-like putative cysteine protease
MKKTSKPESSRTRRLPGLIAGAVAAILSALPSALLSRPAATTAAGAESRAAAKAEAAQLAADRWYVIKIAGNPAGYVHEQVESKAAPGAKTKPAPLILVTTSDMRLVLNRLGSRIDLRFLTSAEEAAEGKLLRTESAMLASNQSTKSDAVVGDGKIEVTSEAGGKTYTNTLPFKGELFGPEAIRRACVDGLKKPGDKIAIQTFVPEASLVGSLTRVVLGREDVEIEGKRVPALKIEETFEGMPVKRTGWLDLEGNLLKQEEPGPFGVMEVVRSEKAAAQAAAAGTELPAEIYEKSIVRTNIRLPRYEPVDRLKLRLTHRNPALGWPDFAFGNQTVLEKSEKDLVLEIRRPAPPGNMTYPVTADADNRQFLEPNAYIQSDDAEIRRLAQELAGQEKDAFKAALAMERWVAEHMTFDLGIVFAPATEVFHSRRGTCVGYATMLATLARAAGIPSRVAMGYVYAQGMFGGHAWAEILAGKEWIPLDAAIVNAGVADATHLAIIASSLAGGPGEMSLGAAQQIFGQVDISILEYETGGKTTVVPADARPFTAEGNRYVNPWLGIALTKPADFAFSKLDAIWPDPTVVGLTGPDGVKAAIVEMPAYPWQDLEKAAVERLAGVVPGGKVGKLTIGEGPAESRTTGEGKAVPAIYSSNGKTAAAAFGRGAVLLVLKVEGPGAADLLRRLASGFEFR